MPLTPGGLERGIRGTINPKCCRDLFAALVLYGRLWWIVEGVAAFMDEVIMDQAWLFREGAFLRSGDHTRRDLREVIRLAGTGRIDLEPSITHRFNFGDLEHVLATLEARGENIIRAVLVLP